LYLNTPLGPDTLLLSGFSGTESLSELFQFDLEILAANSANVTFDKLLGQKISFGVNGNPDDAGAERDFDGICIRVTQGGRDQTMTRYSMTVVPKFWLLTQNFQSRIFQQISVPDILKKVLTGIDADYMIQGTFEPRDYCVQYQESDFHFASRLMEEEGIFYFFEFTNGNHKLVLANVPSAHPDINDQSELIYEELSGGGRTEERVASWQKVQDFRSGKYTLWDHCFELPHKHLDVQSTVVDSVNVGAVTHKLKVAGNDNLEIYEHPGLYAQRFDGIDKSGSPQASEIPKIFDDNKRTVGIRMQQTENPMLLIHGAGNCRQMSAGHRFTLTRHFNADGMYVLVSVVHAAEEGDFRTDPNSVESHYGNHFTCIPFGLPYRPTRKTPRPFIRGCQTAVVVGPGGEEIFTDKYGRVKVQFHWDRQGQYNADSSCWVRVGTNWAGRNWGWITIPRIGQEVVVDFLEGDPDQPIITNSVYNADMMPPYTLPDHKTVSTWKSRSSMQGTPSNFNELRYEDKMGSEQVFFHAEKDKDESVEAESREFVGANRHLIVVASQMEAVQAAKHSNVAGEYHVQAGGDTHMHHASKLLEKIDSDHERSVLGNNYEHITGTTNITVDGDHKEKIGGKLSLQVGGDHHQKTGMDYSHEAGMEVHLKAGMDVVIEAGLQITLQGPGGFISIGPAGVTIQGTMVLINSGGAAGSGTAASPDDPTAPPTTVKGPAQPDTADDGSKFTKLN